MLACFTLFSTRKSMSTIYLKEIIIVGKDLATRIIASLISMRAEHVSVLFAIKSPRPFMVPNKHLADNQHIFNICING